MSNIIKTPNGIFRLDSIQFVSTAEYEALSTEEQNSGLYAVCDLDNPSTANIINDINTRISELVAGASIDDTTQADDTTWSSKYILSKITETLNNADIDFCTEDGYGNIRVYEGVLQYYDASSSTWVDLSISEDNTYITNMYPKDMESIYVTSDGLKHCIKLKWTEPDNTIIDEQLFCCVEGIKIVRKAGSEPTGIDDGDLVLDFKRSEFGKYNDTFYLDESIEFVDGETYYYHFYPYADDYFINTNTGNMGYATYRDGVIVYGFHVSSDESDPSEMITYIEDAVGMTPAHMDYETGEFNYGDWEDAFFMPRPCMLKYDGTVDYYLDPNDYTKKEDGTDSDISNVEYEGNAMIEWGQNGYKIWYKVVPSSGTTSYSGDIYIATEQVDEDYVCYSFHNNQGELVDHFYTAIYHASNDGTRLRSLSGFRSPGTGYGCDGTALTYSNGVKYIATMNQTENTEWYSEIMCDRFLINMLLLLMGKSTDSQTVFGMGCCNNASSSSTCNSPIPSGTMDNKGMFWGENTGIDNGVKVFGMENWWGNLSHVFVDSGKGGSTSVFNFLLTKYMSTEYAFDNGTYKGMYARYLYLTSYDECHGLYANGEGNNSTASASTYTCDYIIYNGKGRTEIGSYSLMIALGGCYNEGYYCGLFRMDSLSTSFIAAGTLFLSFKPAVIEQTD